MDDNKLVPVTLEEACNHLGFEVDEVKDDALLHKNITRLIKFSDTYLKGALGENYPADDERAKELALLIISDLYENRSTENPKVSNNIRNIVISLETQIKAEMRKDG